MGNTAQVGALGASKCRHVAGKLDCRVLRLRRGALAQEGWGNWIEGTPQVLESAIHSWSLPATFSKIKAPIDHLLLKSVVMIRYNTGKTPRLCTVGPQPCQWDSMPTL